MSQIVFLNERSHGTEPQHVEQCRATVEAFLLMMLELRKVMPGLALVARDPLPETRLADGYTIRDWITAPTTRREWRQLMLSLGQRAPFRVARDLLGDPDPGVTEYVYAGIPFDGLSLEGIGLAHLYGGLAVSFRSDERWHITRVPLRYRRYTEDGEERGSASAQHAASSAHIAGHREWLRGCVRRTVGNAADLWSRRADLLPRLDLLPSVENNVHGLEAAAFQQVVSWLFAMNEAIDAWVPTDAPAPRYPFLCTDESRSRRDLCWFVDRDGERRLFSWHGRFTPGPGRIHFRLDGETQKAVIAYIGRKLDA